MLRSLILVVIFLSCFSGSADELNLVWKLSPGDNPNITTGNTERGLTFNASTKNLLVVSRAAGVNVVVFDAATGAELRTLNTEGVAGGTFALNMIGAADDGVVYAGNLSTSTNAPNYRLYRWANDNADTVPTLAFEGDPAGSDPATGRSRTAQRWGDSMDVRGSGPNTQIVIASRASPFVAILTTTDGMTFTATLIADAGVATGSLGVAFGEGNTLWLKAINQPLRHVQVDLAAGKATLLKQFNDPTFPNVVTTIGVDPAKKWLAGVAVATPDSVRLYEISGDPIAIDQENFPTDNANANFVGSVDFGSLGTTNLVFALDTNNGILAHRVVSTPPVAPTISTQPLGQTVVVGAAVTFSVAASGTPPLRYQWQFNQQDVPGATNSTLSLPSVQASQAGTYRVVVTNAAGSTPSNDAALIVNPRATGLLTPLWKVAPGERPYINTDGTQRSIAVNPVNGNVLIVSRTGATKVYVLDGNTGAELRQLNTDPSVVTGGTFALSLIDVADDGVVYGANLVTDSATSPVIIYRWENDTAAALPQQAYSGDPSDANASATNRRFGDTFVVRGAGTNTEILLGSRNGTIAVLLNTTDGNNFTSRVLNTDAAAGDFGLGVAFGEGNSFWGKAPGRALRLIDYNPVGGTGTVRHTFGAPEVSTAIAGIGVDGKSKLLAGISIETPDNLRVFNIGTLPNPPVLLDQQLFPTDNPNVNGTGTVDFGTGKLYAIDSNNGLLAFTVNALGGAKPAAATLSNPMRPGNGAFQFTLSGTAGAAYTIEVTEDLRSWSTVTSVTPGPAGTAQVTDPGAVGKTSRFYRAVAKP